MLSSASRLAPTSDAVDEFEQIVKRIESSPMPKIPSTLVHPTGPVTNSVPKLFEGPLGMTGGVSVPNHVAALPVPPASHHDHRSTKPSSAAAHVLVHWQAKCLPGKRVVVEGFKDGEKWRTSAIATRIDGKTLQTTGGSVYKLQGPMKPTEDLLPEVIERFLDGFPEDWKQLLTSPLSYRATQEEGKEAVEQKIAHAIQEKKRQKSTAVDAKKAADSTTTTTPSETTQYADEASRAAKVAKTSADDVTPQRKEDTPNNREEMEAMTPMKEEEPEEEEKDEEKEKEDEEEEKETEEEEKEEATITNEVKENTPPPAKESTKTPSKKRLREDAEPKTDKPDSAIVEAELSETGDGADASTEEREEESDITTSKKRKRKSGKVSPAKKARATLTEVAALEEGSPKKSPTTSTSAKAKTPKATPSRSLTPSKVSLGKGEKLTPTTTPPKKTPTKRTPKKPYTDESTPRRSPRPHATPQPFWRSDAYK